MDMLEEGDPRPEGGSRKVCFSGVRFIFIYLKGRDLPSAGSLPICLQQLRAWNPTWVSLMGGRDQNTWAITCCFPEYA